MEKYLWTPLVTHWWITNGLLMEVPYNLGHIFSRDIPWNFLKNRPFINGRYLQWIGFCCMAQAGSSQASPGWETYSNPQKEDAENDELGGYHVFSWFFPCRSLVKMQKHSKSWNDSIFFPWTKWKLNFGIALRSSWLAGKSPRQMEVAGNRIDDERDPEANHQISGFTNFIETGKLYLWACRIWLG